MELNWVEYVGLAAGALTTAAYVPQVYKTWRTRAVGDISLAMYVSMTVGTALWLVYGLLHSASAIVAANSVALVLVGGMLRLKLKYGARNQPPPVRGGAPAAPPGGTRPESGPTSA